ncbi:hypothetical protein EC973_001381 [Apophysomyces ossiformis]|uniref:Alpha-1,2-mannosidase n=1 Tax=Apophysomyces ossiformis TaxID=679940 RepID=A0A8H7EV63_9FUNG|nr:hypothetical protein EC973_001381 [Apophysomyces ossiformis]
MQSSSLLAVIVLGFASFSASYAIESDDTLLPLTQYVNQFIGTLGSNAPDPVVSGEAGSVIPAAGLPLGMVQWSPDTNTRPTTNASEEPGSPAGYYYDYHTIESFSFMHMSGAGCEGNDGEFPVTATTDLNNLPPSFSHSNESTSPGYYSVLFDNGVRVELTATLRTGFGRFSFPPEQPAFVVLDATRTNTIAKTKGEITVLSNNTLTGSTMGVTFCHHRTPVKVYFYAEFDQPFLPSSNITQGKAEMRFPSASTVLMKIGISFVSANNAKENLETENPLWNFDKTKEDADTVWNQRLNRIQVTSDNRDDLVKFYTAFYRTQWAPSIFSDVNGQYLGFDNKTYQVKEGQKAQYTAFSGWDIYRSLMSLKGWLFPLETGDALQSLINDADQCGAIPRWVNYNVETGTMPGDSGSLMVAAAYAFGARNFDTAGALNHMKTMTNDPNSSCQGITTADGRASYLKLGYIGPGEADGSASTTLEYASADFAISRFAAALGDTEFAKIELQRSENWANLIDTSAQPPILTARDYNGSWLEPTDEYYVEGNAEQYTWMVPHNYEGLIEKLGGNEKVVERLDQFFSQLNAGTELPHFYMGNEPTFGVPWTYNWAGAPSHTQEVVQRIMKTAFSTQQDGLAGNDDLGSLSGWYVWAALGLYPVIPGVDGLAVSSPQFSSIKIQLGNKNILHINAPGAPEKNYIQNLQLNGNNITRSWLSLDMLANGGTLDFTMGENPSSWGTTTEDIPPSYGASSVII